MASLKSEVAALVDRLVTVYGCTARQTRGGHWVVGRSGFQPVTLSGTPSDRRAVRNMHKDIRRCFGIEL